MAYSTVPIKPSMHVDISIRRTFSHPFTGPCCDIPCADSATLLVMHWQLVGASWQHVSDMQVDGAIFRSAKAFCQPPIDL